MTIRAEEDGRVVRARALRSERRLQILRAARKVFSEKGYYGGSIADIIDAAKIARGTFYLHFESKRAVFGEILEGLLEELNATIERVQLGQERSPYDQLLDNVERVLGVLIENADVTRILLRSGGGNDEEFDQKVAEFYEHALGMITGSLETGIEMGLVRDADVGIYASCVLGSIKEAVDQLVLRRSSGRKQRKAGAKLHEDRRSLAKVLLDYNLYGILVRA
jgi:AcrR family transcriptional regulator